MTSTFRFNVIDVGLPTQRIVFDRDGEPLQEFAIPDTVVPEGTTERFWALYNKLYELGVVTVQTPGFNPLPPP
jgi:hypothetical protein